MKKIRFVLIVAVSLNFISCAVNSNPLNDDTATDTNKIFVSANDDLTTMYISIAKEFDSIRIYTLSNATGNEDGSSQQFDMKNSLNGNRKIFEISNPNKYKAFKIEAVTSEEKKTVEETKNEKTEETKTENTKETKKEDTTSKTNPVQPTRSFKFEPNKDDSVSTSPSEKG